MIIKQHLTAYISANPNSYARYLIKKPELYALVADSPGLTVAEKVFNYLNPEAYNIAQLGCKMCKHTPLKFINGSYRSYCSNKCSTNDPAKKAAMTAGLRTQEAKEKRNKTLLQKYGTTSMLVVNNQKIADNCLVVHGVDHPLKRKDMQQLREAAVNTKYGVSNVFSVDEVKIKSAATMSERYGAEHALQVQQFQDKKKATTFARYGVEHALRSEQIMSKLKDTVKDKYGVDWAMEDISVSKKSGVHQRQASVTRGEFSNRIEMFKSKFLVEPLFTVQEFIDNQDMVPKWRHICGTVYESGWGNGQLLICPNNECRKQSAPQREIFEHVRSLVNDGDITVNDRSVISPLELDIVIRKHGLAIEMDGIYWHQNDIADKKQKLCKERGINLLHITDKSWYDKPDVWKSIIASKLHATDKIYARSCKIVNVTYADHKSFMEENHLQGYVNSSTAYGLMYDNQLVAMMTFGKPRFNTNYNTELLRYANKLNTTVVGGASRLLSHFKREQSGSIVSYAKAEHSNGRLYETLGFKLKGFSGNGYSYWKGDNEVKRYAAQKHKLQELLGSQFRYEESELQNMQRCGYIKVIDRGSFTYILE